MSVVYGAIVVAILLVFIIQFRPNSGQKTGSLKEQCVVVVRDRCIDPKEFWASHALIAPHRMEDAQLKAMGVRRLVAEGLLERELLIQDARRLNLTISDEELSRELRAGRLRVSLPAMRIGEMSFYLGLNESLIRLLSFQNEAKQFDYNVYKRVVRQQLNRGEQEFREMQRSEMIAARMRDMIRSRARIADTEAFSAYQKEKSTVSLEYVRMRRAFFVSNYLDQSPKAVEAWAKEHKAEVDKAYEARKADFPAGCRRLRQVMVKLKTETQKTGHEKAEAEELIKKALERITTGEEFALVAEELSEDETIGKKGAEVACLAKGKLVKEVEDAAWALKKTGDVTAVVASPYGFHIVQLVGAVSDDASKVEADARALLSSDIYKNLEGDRITQETARQVRDAVAGGKPLAQAIDDALAALDAKAPKAAKKDQPKDKKAEPPADPRKPKPDTTRAFTSMDSPWIDTPRDQNVGELAFKLQKPGEVGKDLIRFDDGYAVYLLKERKGASREDFDKDRDAYMGRLQSRKANDLLIEYVGRLKAEARAETRIFEQYVKEAEKESEPD